MHDRALRRCLNVDDVRTLARRRLPRPIFDMVDGAREDEVTLRRNLVDLNAVQLLPRVLRDVSRVETSTRVLGCDLRFPLILSPTGAQGYLDPEGELAAARAAAKAGIMYAFSSFGSETIETVGDVGPGPRMFQLNALVDEELNIELIRRAKAAKFDVFCLTVDNLVSSRHERFERWRLKFGETPPPRTMYQFAKHPIWLWRNRNLKARATPFVIRELQRKGREFGSDLPGLSKVAFARDLTWERVAKLRKAWDGPFLLKGILAVDDAMRAADIGATAIAVCNHGGMALDGSPSSISRVSEIADAVGSRLEILFGGGIRRGTSIVKALAMGAHATMSGRSFLYGLGAAGEAGVSHVIDMLRTEFETALAAVGCTHPEQLDRQYILPVFRQLP